MIKVVRELPNSSEAEQAVLGSAMRGSEWSELVLESLKVDDFYYNQHKVIFELMIKMANKNIAIDATTLSSTISEYGRIYDTGGAPYILAIFESVTTLEHTDYYINTVKELSTKREVITRMEQSIDEMYNPDNETQNVINSTREQLDKVNTGQTGGFVKIGDLLNGVSETIRSPEKLKMSGLSTGFRDFDEMTGGLGKGWFVIIAARPAMGKSSFAFNIATNVAGVGKHVAIMSLEMKDEDIAHKSVDNYGGINFKKHAVRGGLSNSEVERLDYAIENIAKMNIKIDHSSGVEISQMKTNIRQLHKREPLDLVIVDYLQLIKCNAYKGNKTQEVNEISSGLKELARELDIPIIALSQLSRGVEARNDKRPIMSDLRDSGGIEQDADLVAMLYRDDYYKDKGEKKDELVEVLLRKHRFGNTGAFSLKFDGSISRFSNVDFVTQNTQPTSRNQYKANWNN